MGGIRRPLVASRRGWPTGGPAAARRATSFPAARSSAMGRATRGGLDERTPRGHGTGKEPSKRVAPPAGSDTPYRWGGAPPDAAAPVRTCTTGVGLARIGVASVTALDQTGSGPGGDGLDLDASPKRQGGHPEQSRQYI